MGSDLALNWHFDSEEENDDEFLRPCKDLHMTAAMAVLAMAELTGIPIPQLYCKTYEYRRNRHCVVGFSNPAFTLSNSTSSSARRKDIFAGKDGVADRSGLDLRWRTRAAARTAAVEEGVAEAKRAIDEVLLSNGGDDKGAGGLAEVSWALNADEATKKVLADAVTKLCACRGQDFGEFLRSRDAHGVWEVFYAPHIFA